MSDIGNGWLEGDFEVEISAIDADREDAVPPTIQAASVQRLSPKARAWRVGLGASACLAALLIFASVPSLRSQALRLLGGAAAPTPGAGSFSYAPLSTPTPRPGQGWILAGPQYASTIAFAPSAPETAYVCGAQQLSDGRAVPISVGVSSDSGATWQTLSTPATGMFCELTVDPTNARDVVLLVGLCRQCQSPSSKLYRTFDGGEHWSLWSLPPIEANRPAELSYAWWAWVGSTLFLAPYLTDDPGYVRLAASIAGQAFVWLKTKSLFAGAPSDSNIDDLLATNTTLYLQMSSQRNCPPTCTWFMRSFDNGASWARFTPLFQGQPVYLLATGGDGRTLLGQVQHTDAPYSRVYVASTDGGATWQALPPRPNRLATELTYETPDGSIYAAFEPDITDPTVVEGTSAPGIYALTPGASAWRYVATEPAGGWFTVAWNQYGVPIALWGRASTDNLIPGLEVHRP